jgi:hypothetical protein
MPIGLCPFITHADIQPFDLIFMVVIPLRIFHAFDLYVDPVMIYFPLTLPKCAIDKIC